MTLNEVAPGGRVTITAMAGEGAAVQRLFEMGLVEGTRLEVVRLAPLGDPMEVRVAGYLLSLRKHEARGVSVEASV